MTDTAEPMDVSAPEPAPKTDKPASNETADKPVSNETATPSAVELESKADASADASAPGGKATSTDGKPEGEAAPASKKRTAAEAVAGDKVHIVEHSVFVRSIAAADDLGAIGCRAHMQGCFTQL